MKKKPSFINVKYHLCVHILFLSFDTTYSDIILWISRIRILLLCIITRLLSEAKIFIYYNSSMIFHIILINILCVYLYIIYSYCISSHTYFYCLSVIAMNCEWRLFYSSEHQERFRQSSALLSISLLYIDIRYILLIVCLPVKVIFKSGLRQVETRNGRMCYTISVMVKLNECVKFSGFLVHYSISHQLSCSRYNEYFQFYNIKNLSLSINLFDVYQQVIIIEKQ